VDHLSQHVVFALDDNRYALRLSAVERVVHAVEVTTLPRAPDIVLGVINFCGRVIPVFNIRKRFRLPDRELQLSDQIVIALTSKRAVALLVDSVHGVVEHAEQDVVPAAEVLPTMDYVDGVARLEGGLVLIHDLDTFLSIEEERALDDAVE
jgi:purine-binding chemotaxis protein CheW